MRPHAEYTFRAATMFCLLALTAGSAVAAPILFRTARSYGGSYPFMVAGDFDGDGDLDIAGATSTGVVEWWANTGGVLSGPFAIATPFPVRELAAGDLNGDGRADLVGCDAASAGGTIAVLLANGAGFDPAQTVPTDSAGVVAVTLADLDGDHDLDLVAANRITRKVLRLYNDGLGGFSGLIAVRIPGEISRTWVADLDGDSHADILTGNAPNLMLGGSTFGGFRSASWTLRGSGGGAFDAPVPAGVRAIMALGAFSAPGAIDAVVADSLGFGIAAGEGDGTFAPPVFTPGAWNSCGEWFAMALDLDGDGRDEVVGSTGGGCSVSSWGVFHVDGSLALIRRQLYAGYFGFTGVAADLDGNGYPDVLVSSLLVATNHGGRLDGERLLQGGTLYENVLQVQGVDLDGDGAAEVLVVSKYYSGALYRSHHDGSFDPGVSWQTNSYIRNVVVADLDGDGDPDILQLHNDSGLTNHAYTWFNDGTGHAGGTATTTLGSTYALGLNPLDYEGDGDLDALTQSSSPAGTHLLLNDGTGHFTDQITALPIAGTYGPAKGDALPAHFATAGDSIQIEHATAPGVLGPPARTWVGGALVAARFADVNGDGVTDAVCLLAGAQVVTFLGGAGGAWSDPIPSPTPAIATGYAPTFANIGDLDGDGRPDLLFTGAGTLSVVSALRNLGDGLFGERGDSYTNQHFGSVIADVDGDGAADLLGIEPSPLGSDYTNGANILFGIPTVPTPALVSLASATAAFDRATLTWWVPSNGPSALSVERRPEGGAWSLVATVVPSGGQVVYEDRAIEPGRRYSWRLAWTEGDLVQRSQEVSLAIPRRPSFAIAGVRPNPAAGDRAQVDFTLDRIALLEVKLVDVAGRVVASRRVAPAAVGHFEVDLDGLSSLRAGLYFVRAEQAGRRATTMLVRLR